MSCDYFVYCVPCNDRHPFNDANHQVELMRAFIRHAVAIAALTPLSTDTHGDLFLGTAYGRVDPSWFQHHLGHELRVIDEYGKLDGDCGQRAACPHCRIHHPCGLPHGHLGHCTPRLRKT